MNLTNKAAWIIRREHQPETDLEEALLEKIEHMESRIEELEADLDREKQRYADMDDDWDARFEEMKFDLKAQISELEAEVEALRESLDDKKY